MLQVSQADPASVTFREIGSGQDDLVSLERFYNEIYISEFPIRDERESFDILTNYLRLKASGWYGQNNYHILLGFQDSQPVAGSIADYFEAPNCGVIEFLVVSEHLRGMGLGRRLLDATENLLAQDAARLARRLGCIVAEMNDPFRQPQDRMDSFLRTAVWDRWGYRRLDFPYVQPALSANQQPVGDLLLMAKPCNRELEDGLPTENLKAILRDYMLWAMRINLPEGNPQYQEMSRTIGSAQKVALTSLAAYIGRDPARTLVIRDIETPADPDFGRVMAVYARAFPGGPIDIDPDDFRDTLARRVTSGMRYHLWAVRGTAHAAVEGMASFFTFAAAGFGGYVALEGALKGSGRFPLLLARIEEQMIRDDLGTRGWFIECRPEQEVHFRHRGFRRVDLTYRQPSLDQPFATGPELCLMYKEFGSVFHLPTVTREDFLSAMRAIFERVYESEEGSASFASLREEVARWPADIVPFR